MSNPMVPNGIPNPQLMASRGGPQQPLYRPQGVPPNAASNDNYLLQQYQQQIQASQLNAAYANMAANGGVPMHNPAMMGMPQGIVQSSPMTAGGPGMNMNVAAQMGQMVGNGPDGNMMPQPNQGVYSILGPDLSVYATGLI